MFRCVMYDVRGAGGSGAPAAPDGYRVAHLVNDLVAVMDHVSPHRPVHLVGHDWGSVQAWEAVLLAGNDPRLAGRIASYTSISGPALAHVGLWIAGGRRGTWGQRRAVARQLLRSWYVLAFQVPRLPELALRRVLRSPESAGRFLGSGHAAPTVAQDAVNGLGLYRANLRHGGQGRHPLRTDVPVQLIVPRRDPFLTPALYDDLPRLCSDLTRHDLDARHWVQQSHPEDVARLVSGFVQAHETAVERARRPGTDAPGDVSAVRFIDDDEGYLDWLAANSEGFVINTPRHPTPSSIVLHRATCNTVSGTPTRGDHWTLDYIKICGARTDLERHALDDIGGPVRPCGHCLSTSPLL